MIYDKEKLFLKAKGNKNASLTDTINAIASHMTGLREVKDSIHIF